MFRPIFVITGQFSIASHQCRSIIQAQYNFMIYQNHHRVQIFLKVIPQVAKLLFFIIINMHVYTFMYLFNGLHDSNSDSPITNSFFSFTSIYNQSHVPLIIVI